MKLKKIGEKVWKFLNSIEGILGIFPTIFGFVGTLINAFPTLDHLRKMSAAWSSILSIFVFFLTIEILRRKKLGLITAIIILILAIITCGFYWIHYNFAPKNGVGAFITIPEDLNNTKSQEYQEYQKEIKQITLLYVSQYLLVMEYSMIFIFLTIAFTILGFHRKTTYLLTESRRPNKSKSY